MLAMILAEVSGTGLLAVVGIGATIGLIIYVVASNAEEKAVVRSSLRQLEGYDVENVRDQELLAPIRDRALLPAVKGLTDIGRRFTPTGYVDKVRQKFVYAGDASPDAVDRFLALRVLTVVIGVLGAMFLFFGMGFEGLLKVAAPGFWLLAFII